MTAGFFYYASFPNSRIKPRPATSNAVTYQTVIAEYTLPLTKIISADLNRTYMLIENLSLTTGLWYVYAAASLINPSVVATIGVPKDLIYFGTQLYQKQDQGVTTNWIPVSIQNVGEFVAASQTASLDSPQDVWAAANSAGPVIPAVKVGIDLGTG